MRSPIVTTSQLIHGDLTENILFAEGLSPAVIDFSPYWRPVGLRLLLLLQMPCVGGMQIRQVYSSMSLTLNTSPSY